MRIKQFFALLIFSAFLGLAAWKTAPATIIYLKAQQTITVVCQGDELIVTPYGDTETAVTCRVWVQADEDIGDEGVGE